MKAASSLENRVEEMEATAELIETNMILLGATGVEDKLQQDVPKTISMLLEADIKVWILTGDKMETAINIGYSCNLLKKSTRLIFLTEDDLLVKI